MRTRALYPKALRETYDRLRRARFATENYDDPSPTDVLDFADACADIAVTLHLLFEEAEADHYGNTPVSDEHVVRVLFQTITEKRDLNLTIIDNTQETA